MRIPASYVMVVLSSSMVACVGPATAQNYTYDTLGRVTQVITSSGVTTVYHYDAASNRTEVVVTGATSISPVSGATVPNGWFELPDEGSGFQYTPSVAGMTFSGISGIAANGSAWGFANAPEGKQVGFLQSSGGVTGAITITVSNLAAGQHYVVLLQASQRPGYPLNPFTIAADGTMLSTISPNQGFGAFASAPFVAVGSTASLVLSATTASQDAASGIDALAVVPVPIVTDASFEAPALGAAGYQYNPVTTGVTFSGGAGVAANGSAWGFPTPIDGNQVAFLQSGDSSNAAISQSVAGLVPGQRYAVIFQASHRPMFGVDPVTVSVGGAVLMTVSPPDQFTGYVTPTFVANTSTTTVVFSVGHASGDSGSGIDAVSVVPR